MSKKESVLKMLRFIYKIYPSLFPLIVVCQMANAAIPFVNIIFGTHNILLMHWWKEEAMTGFTAMPFG